MKRKRALVTEAELNALSGVPFERWQYAGVSLSAVSANGDGMVNSGITRGGQYFYKKWDYCPITGRHTNPRFVLEGK